MSFIVWTFILAILFIIYRFQLRDLGTGSSWIIASVEVTVLSFLCISAVGIVVILGIVLGIIFYFANHYLQSHF